MFRIIIGVAMSCALSLPALGAEALKIGVIGPMSGGAAQWGLHLQNGAELKAQEINASGGLKVGQQTYNLQIVPYDHKSNAAEAITVTNKLIFQDGVKYIVGNAIGSTTAAAQTITEPNKVLFTFISFGKAALGPKLPYSFRTDLSDVEVVGPFYRWLSANKGNLKRVAILNPNDQSGKGAGAQMVAAAKTLGMTVVAEEYYDRAANDFYPIITRISAQKPDFIDFGASSPGSAGLIAKQLYEMGFKGVRGWTSGVNLASLVEISGKEAGEGVLSPWSVNLTNPDAPPALKKFAKDYRAKFNEAPDAIGLSNYVALDVLTQAMTKAGSIDTDKVKDALASGIFDAASGKISVGGMETYGINRQFLRPVVITEIRNGEAVDVGTVMPTSESSK
jgi:branched-chain amino acid transport system substrate-binding protein